MKKYYFVSIWRKHICDQNWRPDSWLTQTPPAEWFKALHARKEADKQDIKLAGWQEITKEEYDTLYDAVM